MEVATALGDVMATLNHTPQPIVPLDDTDIQHFIENGFVTVRASSLSDDFHAAVAAKSQALHDADDVPGWGSNDCYPVIDELGYLLKEPHVHGALTGLLGDGYAMHPHRHCHERWAQKRHAAPCYIDLREGAPHHILTYGEGSEGLCVVAAAPAGATRVSTRTPTRTTSRRGTPGPGGRWRCTTRRMLPLILAQRRSCPAPTGTTTHTGAATSAPAMVNFAFKRMIFVLQTRYFVLKTRSLAFKRLSFAGEFFGKGSGSPGHWCHDHDEYHAVVPPGSVVIVHYEMWHRATKLLGDRMRFMFKVSIFVLRMMNSVFKNDEFCI